MCDEIGNDISVVQFSTEDAEEVYAIRRQLESRLPDLSSPPRQ